MSEAIVTVNGIEHVWYDTERVSYEEFVRAAFPEADVSRVWTVVYRFRYTGGLSGSLVAGESIPVGGEGLVVNVVMTDNA